MDSLTNLVLPPLSLVYSAVINTRLAAYRRGFLSVTSLDVPVISVGNLTTGGTGKTPLVEWICRALAPHDRRVCILTRGYGRANSRTRVVVSDGELVLANAEEAGDEPLLLAQNLKGLAAVISDSDRVAAGKWAIENLGASVFVLDDGFQHLRLGRDLNILVIDATNPWGGGNLLPHGRLREPKREASRADCVVITRANQRDDIALLKEEIKSFIGARPILTSNIKVKGLTNLSSGVQEDIATLAQPAAAFCAIGNPQSFFDQLRRAGLRLAITRSFPDHHIYTDADIQSLLRESSERGAQSLITTAKDCVKLAALNFDIPCYVLQIDVSIAEESKFVEMIESVVRA